MEDYKNSNNSGDLIRNFFDRGFDINESEKFFRQLHKEEVGDVQNIQFSLYLREMEGFWGRFIFRGNEFWDEEQTLFLHNLLDWKNQDLRKAVQLITYFHEATHKKQRDMFVVNRKINREELSQYNNLLSLEIFCAAEAKVVNHEQQLVEIDAIHNSIIKFYQHMRKGEIPTNLEILAVILYACVRYFASINGEKHHTYCPEKYTTKSEKVIENHKEFYSKFVKQYSATCKETLPELIRGSDLISEQQKRDLANINFDVIPEEINKKTQEVCVVMRDIFNQIIKLYQPSKSMLAYFNIDKTQWNKILKTQNIVKLSALICDDFNSNISSKWPKILPREDETILE